MGGCFGTQRHGAPCVLLVACSGDEGLGARGKSPVDFGVPAHERVCESKGMDESLVGRSPCKEEVPQRNMGWMKELTNLCRTHIITGATRDQQGLCSP